MLKGLRVKIARWIARDYFDFHAALAQQNADTTADAVKRADDAELSANRRYAELVSKMDPLEPLFKNLSIVYSEEFTRVEEKLDDKSQLGFMMWAYGTKNDRYFNFLVDWIINSHGNETLKRAPVTNERTLYGRAQISSMVLLRAEVGRLSSLYEEKLEEMRQDKFDTAVTVE